MSFDVEPESGAILSALMDGEGGEFEVRRALALVSQDPELRRKWGRYHLAATAMRGELATLSPDLSARIAAALDSEPAPRNRTVLRAAGRVAVAASVAFLTVVGVRYLAPISGGGKGAEVAVQEVRGGQTTAAQLPSQQIPLGLRLPPVRVATVSDAASAPISRTGPVVGIAPAVEQREVRGYMAQRLPRHAERTAVNHQDTLPLARPQDAPQPAGQ